MEILLRGDAAMNLIGLILMAVLSGGIVAVSLRLRASASPARMWLESDLMNDEELQAARSRSAAWLQGSFGLKGESGPYRSVRDQLGG